MNTLDTTVESSACEKLVGAAINGELICNYYITLLNLKTELQSRTLAELTISRTLQN